MAGWIKLSRCISEHWIFQDALKFKWWVLIILNVNYKESKFLLGSKVYDIKRGSSTNSLRKWALILNTGVKSVNSYFELLEKEGMITKQIIGKGKQSTTLINITNYTKYQSLEETQGGTLEGTLKGTQRKHEGHTEEERKEVNKERKKVILDFSFCNENLVEDFKSFVEFRKSIKKPFTTQDQLERLYKKLRELSGGKMETAKKILDQSIVNGWQGVFELKEIQKTEPKKELKEIPASAIFNNVQIDYGNYPHNED
jgi:hypothetical protein